MMGLVDPVDDLVTNVEGGLSGFADFVGGGESD